jgi:hypothetical protein
VKRHTDPQGTPPPSHISSVKRFNSFYNSELLTVKGKVRIKCEHLVYCFMEIILVIGSSSAQQEPVPAPFMLQKDKLNERINRTQSPYPTMVWRGPV